MLSVIRRVASAAVAGSGGAGSGSGFVSFQICLRCSHHSSDYMTRLLSLSLCVCVCLVSIPPIIL